MFLALLAISFLAFLLAGYRLYGGWVARQLAPDDARTTPAHRLADGVDYVPARPFYLFAQHFSAIAAAGPIAGPILACQSFGWLPCALWVGLGVILIGAVHDFSSLFASVRHEARSVAEIAREHVGSGAGRAMMAFIWIALVYVIVAFADITSASFVVGTEELAGRSGEFHPGGAVAAASVMYLLLAVAMGVVQRLFAPPLRVLTLVFVPATFAAAWLGTEVSGALQFERREWAVLIVAYCAIAAVVPVWALLQPRGYLGGFVLYTALALGVVGVLFGGYEIRQPAFKAWDAGGATGSLFPFLFVTIACGACSGFHGLVCSGTTSKQLDRESHARPIGFGAMLAEGFVALIALVTVMIAGREEIAGLAPGTIYGNGIGRFLTLLIGEDQLGFAVTFGAMAFSTFVFDTLDVCTRLGRYIVQELFGWKGRWGAFGGTILTTAPPAWFVVGAEGETWKKFWTLFGASNQLLAALTLLAITLWLRRSGRRWAFAALPMVFVFSTTVVALVLLARASFRTGGGVALVNGLVATVLVGLAVYFAAQAVRSVRRRPASWS
jgi:carbon starvation protein